MSRFLTLTIFLIVVSLSLFAFAKFNYPPINPIVYAQGDSVEDTTETQENPGAPPGDFNDTSLTDFQSTTNPDGSRTDTYSYSGPTDMTPGSYSATLDDGSTMTTTVTVTDTGFEVSITVSSPGTIGTEVGAEGVVPAGNDSSSGSADPGAAGTPGDSGYVPANPTTGVPVQTLTSVLNAGCSGNNPLVRIDFTASYSQFTARFEIWRRRVGLDDWTLIRELPAPGSYLDTTLSANSYSATYTEYFIRRIDNYYGNLDSNHLQINAANCTATPPLSTGVSVIRNICVGNVPNVEIGWTAASGTISYYVTRVDPDGVERGVASGITGGGLVDSPPLSNSVYTYNVRAFDSSTQLSSAPASASLTTLNCNSTSSPPPTGPVAPAPNITRNVCINYAPNVEVFWGAAGGTISYYVTRVDPGGIERGIASGTTNGGLVDSPPFDNTSYTYNVRAYDSSTGLISSPGSVSVVTTACPPPPPSITSVTPFCIGTTSMIRVNLFVSAKASGFYVNRLMDGLPVDTRGPYPTTILNYDTVVDYGHNYQYMIASYNGGGWSLSGVSAPVAALDCAAPITTFTINNSLTPLVQSSDTATFAWSSQHATSCVSSSNPIQAFWNSSSIGLSGSITSPSLIRPPARPAFSVTCVNGNNNTSYSSTVNVDINTVSCLKTTGGDVHSNQSITAPAQCN